MPVIDYILLGAAALSALLGLVRGFFREALSLVTWILAIWLALKFGDVFAPMLEELLPSEALELWGARLGVFIVVLVAGALINRLLLKLVRSSGLSGVDRVLGGLFGIARGVLIVGVMVLGAQALELDRETWWPQSRVVPYGLKVASEIRTFIGESLDSLGEKVGEPEAAEAKNAEPESG
jgi:membrane protein required for colicin V production